MEINDQFFILTGGPGMGKTAVIAALRERGHITVPETGRHIIRQQVAAGGHALPWDDRAAFAQLMFEQSVADYQANREQTAPVFFDRGIADTIGYLELCGLPVPEDMLRIARSWRFNKKVFLAPPWQAIYEQDTERKQSFAEAVATCECMISIYRRLDYKLIYLPESTVAARADFIMAAVNT
ncbi:AAA family ATPase [Chitinophaga arvensicola]|uniref:Predicted ATPase n=1 Tax=Chitinophaga arvensicola TaxID=29529 RepID=A0A1I0S7G7_9BACT|nr:AAA family ATPase [Chitinophaga arvensicola]SEW51665.1 Predicted ATPase [Chitinophaga arvensicola]